MPVAVLVFETLPSLAHGVLPARRRIPCLRGAGCCRSWASWPSRCPTWRSLCRRRQPCGQEFTREHRANQALHHRRLRIEHVNSWVKRCRIVKDRIHLWKEGIHDLVMELCCALHNFRVRLTLW